MYHVEISSTAQGANRFSVGPWVVIQQADDTFTLWHYHHPVGSGFRSWREAFASPVGPYDTEADVPELAR